jgi:hypothetical protein
MKLGTRPSMEAALQAIYRVAAKLGGDFAQRWKIEAKLIATRLAEGSPFGPKHARWPNEAARLKLAADIAERTHGRQVALANGKALAARLPELEGKATTAVEHLEVFAARLQLEAIIGEEVEQIELDPRSGRRGGKAMAGMDTHTERRFALFLEEIGGRPADGRGYLDRDVLACEERTFERGAALWYGETEPETERERRALARWKGEGP